MKLQRLDTVDGEDLLDGELEGVEAVRIFLLVYCRNTWQGVRSRYSTDRALFTTKGGADRDAETMRNQGTRFELEEVPALRLNSMLGSVVITEINTNAPLSRWGRETKRKQSELLRRGERLEDIVRGFGAHIRAGWLKELAYGWSSPAPGYGSLLTAKLPLQARTEPAGIRELRAWYSKPIGTDWDLDWVSTDSPYSRNGVRRLVDVFRRNSPGWREAQQRLATRQEDLRRQEAHERQWSQFRRMLDAISAIEVDESMLETEATDQSRNPGSP